MSGTRPTSAEQHLGDRLAALVDGELSHDVRERVLSHLATCAKCKAEADAQRRLKNVFSTTAPPPPSEGLLARLQGLPGGGSGGGPDGEDGDGTRPFGQGGFGHGVFGGNAPGARPGGTFDFHYVPAAGHGGALPGAASGRGFRIHDVGRAEAERSGGRGRRLAFARRAPSRSPRSRSAAPCPSDPRASPVPGAADRATTSRRCVRRARAVPPRRTRPPHRGQRPPRRVHRAARPRRHGRPGGCRSPGCLADAAFLGARAHRPAPGAADTSVGFRPVAGAGPRPEPVADRTAVAAAAGRSLPVRAARLPLRLVESWEGCPHGGADSEVALPDGRARGVAGRTWTRACPPGRRRSGGAVPRRSTGHRGRSRPRRPTGRPGLRRPKPPSRCR